VCAFHVLEVEPRLIAELVNTGKAKIVYRHLTQIGAGSLQAAEAMHCAGEQGQYWQMRKTLYERQNDLYSTGSIEGALQFLAGELGLKTEAFTSCMQEQRYRAEVEADVTASLQAGVRSRPVFDVNGTRLLGAHRFEEFAALLDAAPKSP
jgi:protein-disulfide isomerase